GVVVGPRWGGRGGGGGGGPRGGGGGGGGGGRVVFWLFWSRPRPPSPAAGAGGGGPPPLGSRPADADAIVVLGGYAAPANAVRPEPELNAATLGRCHHAARLYREGRCKVVVSGGGRGPGGPRPPPAGGVGGCPEGRRAARRAP